MINQLPRSICLECVSVLNSYFLFKVQSAQVDRNLREMLLEEINFQEADEVETKVKHEIESLIPQYTSEPEFESVEQVIISEPPIEDEKSDEDEEYTNNEEHGNMDNQSSSSSSDEEPLSKLIKMKKGRKSKFFCIACSKGFRYENTFNLHNEKTHNPDNPPPKDYKCETCNEIFMEVASYNRHLRIHGFPCSKCDQMFKLKHLLKTHIYKEHDPVPCPQCDKRFRSKKSLSNHVRSFHNKERNHVCHICDRGFYEFTNLRKHITRHSSERNVSCDVCNKTFKTIDNLKTHKKIHMPADERKNYLCQYCGKTSLTPTGYTTHLQRHIGDKKFECTTCGKTFIAKYQLQVHIRSHTGERPFHCKICLTDFKHTTQLKNHIATHHSDEKNFPCSICDSSFKTKRVLNSHMSNVHLVVKKSSVS